MENGHKWSWKVLDHKKVLESHGKPLSVINMHPVCRNNSENFSFGDEPALKGTLPGTTVPQQLPVLKVKTFRCLPNQE